jgi:hypothetical protein
MLPRVNSWSRNDVAPKWFALHGRGQGACRARKRWIFAKLGSTPSSELPDFVIPNKIKFSDFFNSSVSTDGSNEIKINQLYKYDDFKIFQRSPICTNPRLDIIAINKMQQTLNEQQSYDLLCTLAQSYNNNIEKLNKEYIKMSGNLYNNITFSQLRNWEEYVTIEDMYSLWEEVCDDKCITNTINFNQFIIINSKLNDLYGKSKSLETVNIPSELLLSDSISADNESKDNMDMRHSTSTPSTSSTTTTSADSNRTNNIELEQDVYQINDEDNIWNEHFNASEHVSEKFIMYLKEFYDANVVNTTADTIEDHQHSNRNNKDIISSLYLKSFTNWNDIKKIIIYNKIDINALSEIWKTAIKYENIYFNKYNIINLNNNINKIPIHNFNTFLLINIELKYLINDINMLLNDVIILSPQKELYYYKIFQYLANKTSHNWGYKRHHSTNDLHNDNISVPLLVNFHSFLKWSKIKSMIVSNVITKEYLKSLWDLLPKKHILSSASSASDNTNGINNNDIKSSTYLYTSSGLDNIPSTTNNNQQHTTSNSLVDNNVVNDVSNTLSQTQTDQMRTEKHSSSSSSSSSSKDIPFSDCMLGIESKTFITLMKAIDSYARDTSNNNSEIE